MKVLVFLILAVAVRAHLNEKCWKKLDIGILIKVKDCAQMDKETVRPIVKDLVDNLLNGTLWDNKVSRIGLITYGGRVQISHSFEADQSEAALLYAANKYKFEPGNMPLDEALEDCIAMKCFPHINDQSVKKVVIVITDAFGENSSHLAKQAKVYRDNGFVFVAINAEDKKDFLGLKNSLGALSSDECSNIEKIIEKLIMQIKNDKCEDEQEYKKPSPSTAPPKVLIHADIVFAIDSSFSLTKEQWQQEIDFAKSVVTNLVVGRTGARFAALSFDNRVSLGFEWTDDVLATLTGLDGLKFGEGRATFTDAAIAQATQVYFGTKYKARPGHTAKMIVVITDGSPSKPQAVREAAKKAQIDKITTFAVGVSPNMRVDGQPTKSMLDIVNGDALHLFLVNQHYQLATKIIDLISALQKTAKA